MLRAEWRSVESDGVLLRVCWRSVEGGIAFC